MKKLIVIGAFVMVAVLALGAAGFAYAQTLTPDNPETPYGPGMMGRWSEQENFGTGMMSRGNGRGFGRGMMGRNAQDGSGLLHTYMVDAFAQALGTTSEDLQAQLDAGETMWTVDQAQGLSVEEFTTLMVTARTSALNQAVADGVLTQEQADWMIQRMQQRQGGGFGPGNCPMGDGYGPAATGQSS